MVYLARGNLALSITLTSASTLLAPVMTPLWMKTLAGELVQVDGFKMMMDIVRMVLVPIAAALVHDFLKHASRSEKRLVWSTAVLGALWFTFLALAKFGHLPLSIPLQFAAWNEGVSLLSGAVVVGTLYHALTLLLPWLDRRMPLVSMFGIIYFTAVTTAAGREDLLKIGGLLFLAAVIHNAAGYCFGYWLSRGMGMDRTAARTVAFEVGLQNGGMASGLAGLMGKLGTIGLAAAIFSPWMNVSGSILANYWRKHPTDADETNVASA
jgi:BASS family bile acid:Na+ symporter